MIETTPKHAKVYLNSELNELKNKLGTYTYGIITEIITVKELIGNTIHTPQFKYHIEPISYTPEGIDKVVEYKNVINKEAKFVIHERKILKYQD